IDEADKPEEFENRILQGRCSKQQLVFSDKRRLECVRNDIGGLVDVAEAMGFIDDNKVPSDAAYIASSAFRKLIGTDDNIDPLERPRLPLLDSNVVRS